jgi:NAD(P)H-hydrate repair Nnr-like enzyme with NAD(P)H-hydrate dehydratase domain
LINPTGNPRLAAAGTGDVLAGMIGSALALPGCTNGQSQERVAQAVFLHGWLADHWETKGACADSAAPALSASRLADRVRPAA